VTLVDTHAHLGSSRFDDDRLQVVERAQAAGVHTIINIGTDLASSRQALMLAREQRLLSRGGERFDHIDIYASVGIHPHEAAKARPDDLVEIERLCVDPTVVAIGEIGLDFHYNFSPPDVQRKTFIAQLALARRLGKVVVVHDREAHAETLSILSKEAQGLLGVLHCFSGDAEMAAQVLQMGWFLSFGGPVTFPNARHLQHLVRELPLECILLETDCPYLAPHPQRGKRNEPAYMTHVANQIAQLKDLPVERVAEATTENARRLFGLRAA